MKKPYIIKFVSFLFVILTFVATKPRLISQFRAAKAEESGAYLRVITADTPFYAETTATEPLFYLPYTYYVRAIEKGDYFTRVEYGNDGYTIDGYVPSEKLFYDGLKVDNPFPQTEVFTAKTATLYKDAALQTTVQHVFEARKLYLYGGFLSPQNQPVYYVCYNNKLGYVKEEDITPFVIENHPNELTFLTQDSGEPDPEPQEKATENSALTLRVAIIAVLALAGFFALFFSIGKKSKTSAAAGYYDENDYE